MPIYFNESKSPDGFNTLSRDWVAANVSIDWEECYVTKTEKELSIFGKADKLKGVTNFKDKEWTFKPSLLLIKLPLQPFTYKEKTTEVADITKLFSKFLDDGVLSSSKAFKGYMGIDDTAEKFIQQLINETPDKPLDPVRKECFLQAFLDGELIDGNPDSFTAKLPSDSFGGKGSYKRVSLADKNTELLQLLYAQFPGFFTAETAPNLAAVYELIAGNPEMIQFVVAIMGMI